MVNNTCYLANRFQFVKYGLSKSHFRHVFTVQHCLHYKEQSSGTLIIFKIATSVLTFHNIMNCSQNRIGTKVFVKSFILKNERKHNCTGVTIKQQWVNFYQAETKPLMLIRVIMRGQSHLRTHKNYSLKNPVGSIKMNAGVTDHLCGTWASQSSLLHPTWVAPNFRKETG